MKDIECFCHSPIHINGVHEFKVYPPLYNSGKTILCPECGTGNHISAKVHENPFTLESAKAAFGINMEEE